MKNLPCSLLSPARALRAFGAKVGRAEAALLNVSGKLTRESCTGSSAAFAGGAVSDQHDPKN